MGFVRGAGVALVFLTGFIYWQIHGRFGVLPSGHPSTGIMLIAVGLSFLFGAQRLGETAIHRITALSTLGLSLLFILMWFSNSIP